MNPIVRLVGLLMLSGAVATSAAPADSGARTDSAAVKARLARPSRDYAPAPLWVWNDRLSDEQIRGTLRDLAGQKVKQAIVHPRPGLMTPYLSPEWFRLWKVALDEAERLDMNLWIYDENSYPSGFAGGLVPEAMPEARGRGIHFAEVNKLDAPGNDVLAVFRWTNNSYQRVPNTAQPAGRYLVARQRLAPTGGWFAGKFYVDLLHPGVTEKFLALTHESYRREIGQHFGKRVPGVFTDEPHLAPAGGLHWSEHLPRAFEKRWGYNLIDHLPALVRPVGEWKRVRHDYQRLLLELFIDRWSRPNHDYCQKHGLEWTGHYWEHGWPDASHGPDNMAMYAWHQRPAIDILMNQYAETTNAQFGNARSVKELSSVANQLGLKRTLCEAYGAGGWDLRFEDMKRIGDWLYVLGVNTLDEHLSYITLRGARKADHPQSFSYHTPWWPAYHVMAEYFTRLSWILSSGEQVHRVLLLEPTTSAWLYQNDPSARKSLVQLGDAFQQLVNDLERAQAEYDLGSEDILGRHGAVEPAAGGVPPRLRIGRRAYQLVVLPPRTETLNDQTMRLLEGFVKAGGAVLCCGEPPSLVDGRPSPRGQALAALKGWRRCEAAAVPASVLDATKADGFAIVRPDDDKGRLFHHRRQLADGEVVFLVNTSIDSPSAGVVRSKAKGVERWCPQTGIVQPYPCKTLDVGIELSFTLPPSGSLLVFLARAPLKGPAAQPTTPRRLVSSAGALTVRRGEPNVLTLDYLDLTAGGETHRQVYHHRANQIAFQKNGMEANPWDSAVQLRDELISRKFPADSGFEAAYRFTVAGELPRSLDLVLERPDLYRITCNGKPIAWSQEDTRRRWWLDHAFGRIDIRAAARVGENVVTLKAQPFTLFHELAPAYLLGDFALQPVEKGFVVAPETPLKLGPWNEQGHPLYAAGVAYARSFDLPAPSGRLFVRLPRWYGSVARVLVNGELAGHVAYPPWECEVTKYLKPGANTVEVTVIGTLRNTLGPHHAGALLGTAWPAMFHRAPVNGPPPGQRYHTVGYGMMEPFIVEQAP